MLRRLIYALSIRLWSLGRVAGWLARLPLVGPRLADRLFDPDQSLAVMIPVGEAIPAGQNVVLPFMLLPALVERAAHRAVLNHCMCREAEGCQTYPQDLGCLFLGEGAKRIDSSLGHQVTRDEAMAHIARAMELGLMPTMLHSSLDAFMLQIPFRRMLAICFCCDCCCTIRKGLRAGPPAAWETVVRLPGLSVEVAESCVGCGACIEVCPVQAITISAGRATVGESCKGCGRCAMTCPVDAISLRIDAEEVVLTNLLALIESRTAI